MANGAEAVTTTTTLPPCVLTPGDETGYLVCLRERCQDATVHVMMQIGTQSCKNLINKRDYRCQTDMHDIQPTMRKNHLSLLHFCQGSCPCGTVLSDERAAVQSAIDAELKRDAAAVTAQFLDDEIQVMVWLIVVFFLAGIASRCVYINLVSPMIKYYLFRRDGHQVTKSDSFCRRHWLRITIFSSVTVSLAVALGVAAVAAQDAVRTVGQMNGDLLNNFVTEVSEGILNEMVDMDGGGGAVPWPLYLSNPSSAELHIKSLTGSVAIYGVTVASISTEDQVILAPDEEGTLLVILEQHWLLVGGLLAVLTLYMSDFMRVSVSLALGGLFSGETFHVEATLQVPFNTSKFPEEMDAAVWAEALGYNSGILVKRAMLDGLRVYAQTGEVMMQYDSMSVDGGVTASGTASIRALRAVVAIISWAVGELLVELARFIYSRRGGGRSRASTFGTDSAEISRLKCAQMHRQGMAPNAEVVGSSGMTPLSQGPPSSHAPLSCAPPSGLPQQWQHPPPHLQPPPPHLQAPPSQWQPSSQWPAQQHWAPPSQWHPTSQRQPASQMTLTGQQPPWQPASQASLAGRPPSHAGGFAQQTSQSATLVQGSGTGRRSGFWMTGWGGAPERAPAAKE